jgi:pimeloyl-ACP methyl ester carboxylesterase
MASLAKGVVHFVRIGTGLPLLYLHNTGGIRQTPAIERLARSRTVYLPIVPGFDGTEPIGGIETMTGLADLMAEFVTDVIGPRCDVLGHSFGGWLAAWLATRHPGTIEQLILVAPAGFRPDGQGGLPSDPAALRRALYSHPEKLSEDKPPTVLAQNRAMLAHYHATAATDWELVEKVGGIDALTLVMIGTNDGVIPAASGHLLKRQIPQLFFVYVYDAAHAVDIDQPNLFAELIEDFLSRGEAFIVNRSTSAAA